MDLSRSKVHWGWIGDVREEKTESRLSFGQR